MNSAKTIRICSVVLTIIEIIATFTVISMLSYSRYSSQQMAITLLVGVFVVVLNNAVLLGIADIIDNTYAIACKAYGIPITISKDESGQTVFRKANINSKDERDII